jgi:two-component system OmpR family sensor kinase
MRESLNILLIEDDDEHALIISRYIRVAERSIVKLVRESRLESGLSQLKGGQFDAVLLDLRLPDSDIDSTLGLALREAPEVPIVVLSSLEDRDLALKVVHDGAQDYLCKSDLSSELLIRTVYSAIERKITQKRIQKNVLLTQALFELSQNAIIEGDIQVLTDRMVSLISTNLNVKFAYVLKHNSENENLIVKAGTGWRDGVVGSFVIEANLSTYAGYTLLKSRPGIIGDLRSHEPVIVKNLMADSRFTNCTLLNEHRITSGMAVVIYGKDELNPYGVLAVHSIESRLFSAEEASFLQAVANTYAAAILRRLLEDELKLKIDELNVAHRRKDEFLATLSHELRTPLNIIIGNIEVLRSSEVDSKDFWEAIAAIERGARSESQLVGDTLEMSSIVTGKLRLEMTEITIEDVIESALESVKFAAAAKNILIRSVGFTDGIKLAGDEGRLRQVVWNLLSNAVKFTPERGSITISVESDGASVEFSVADSGKGISPEGLSRVFERFWQEDSSINRKYMGLGLGLAIVRHIIEMHGGTVRVASRGPGCGAVFTVILPIRHIVSVDSSPEFKKLAELAKSKIQDQSLAQLKNKRILLIDDSVDSLQLLVRLLERRGAIVDAASDPEQGLEYAKSGKYDILVSDIGMPVLSGYELISQLRIWEFENGRTQNPLPSIALTAYAMETDEQRAIEAGFQAHISKPIDFGRLAHAISKFALANELPIINEVAVANQGATLAVLGGPRL